MIECILTVHRERLPLLVDFDGPDGRLGSMESRLALRGPDYRIMDGTGAGRFAATRRSGLALRVEVHEGDRPRATLIGSMFPFVNPRARIEGVEGGAWTVWKYLASGEVEFRIDGREILRMGEGVSSRGWRTATETRPVNIDPALDPLLALALTTLALECI